MYLRAFIASVGSLIFLLISTLNRRKRKKLGKKRHPAPAFWLLPTNIRTVNSCLVSLPSGSKIRSERFSFFVVIFLQETPHCLLPVCSWNHPEANDQAQHRHRASFNFLHWPPWYRDLAIPVRCSTQLSYEATDVGSWSFLGSNGPVRNESMMKWYMK